MMISILFLTGCTVTTTNNIGKSSLEYNIDYLNEHVKEATEEVQIIAEKFDDYNLGKIITNKYKIVNGDGQYILGDGKNELVLVVQNYKLNYITLLDGDVIYDFYDENYSTEEIGSSESTIEEPKLKSDPEESEIEGIENEEIHYEQTNTTNNLLSSDVQSVLNSLETDYNKVNWGVQYSPFENLPGIVFSLTPYINTEYSTPQYYLIMAITNLYDQEVTISADGIIKGQNGNKIGTSNIYDVAIGTGSTIIHDFYCEEMPTGEIFWSEIKTCDVFDKYIPWECGWEINVDDNGFLILNYELSGDDELTPGYIYALVLDKNGYVIGCGREYNNNKINSNDTTTGIINFYRTTLDSEPNDIAIFANPIN